MGDAEVGRQLFVLACNKVLQWIILVNYPRLVLKSALHLRSEEIPVMKK